MVFIELTGHQNRKVLAIGVDDPRSEGARPSGKVFNGSAQPLMGVGSSARPFALHDVVPAR